MTYDPSFDQFRLDQLADQCLSGNSGEGMVIFLSDSDDNRLDVTSWWFEDEDAKAKLMKSEFKLYLVELLDNLLVYRAQHNQPYASQGVVRISDNRMSIEWLSRPDAEAMREFKT